MERRLVAILAADVVGYSRLMGADESGTLQRLKSLRKELVQPEIAKRKGRIVKLMGDGLLAEFPSVVEAVQCAVNIQQSMIEREVELPGGRRIRLRIGVNLGDIIVEGSDIYGEGVNVAARLEALADPGGICISGSVFDQVKGKVDLDFADLGERQVKNIDQPVRVYRITLEGEAAERETDGASTARPIELELLQKPAIAVLPFENMSGDPEQEYFSDGLADDIITALSYWRSFPVVARNSSFSFKGQKVRVEKIAEELGVRYILEGSVRKMGRRLRITAQLIDAQTGHHLWAERFDRQLEDIFDIQDEITNRIAATIVPELEHFEHRHSTVKRTEDLNAWDYYLRGMETFHDETCDGTASSIRMFRSAVDLDPNYCDAWARLGWAYGRFVMFKCVDDPDATLRLGFEASRKAVALDNSSAVAHMGLGECHIWAEETDLGLAEAQIALELNPNFAIAAMSVGNRLDLVGRTEEGIAQMERALTLNPRDPNRWRYMAYLSRAYIGREHYQRAADWARKAALLRPDLPEALFRCAVCIAHLDELDEAKALLDRCRAIDPNYLSRMSGWRPYADQARNEHVLSGLRRHGLFP
ncbi:MAG TPA: adenylate/guanylate cyclase domain-containing protein [Kiloniellales bacterium]